MSHQLIINTVKQQKLILMASIVALISTFSPAFAIPEPSFGGTPADTDALDPDDAEAWASGDANRIRGNIARCLARQAPYTDILDGGTLESGLSDTVRSIVQERAVPNVSLVAPEFTEDISMCGDVGDAMETGTTDYSFSLATLRGMGPLVCVKGMRNAFESTYTAAEDALRKVSVQIVNADIRSTLTKRSGCKLVVRTDSTFEQMFSGDSQEVDTAFTTDVGLPDAAVSIKLLQHLGIFMRENLLVDGFQGANSDPLLKVIGSQEIIQALRDQSGVRDDHRYLASGSYQVGKDSLLRYKWEGPYRGFAYACDTQPLRFSVLDGNGQPVYIEPEISKNATKGSASRVSPAWARARFEVLLVVGADSFKRLTPAQYTGEGSFRFPAQVSMGELKFKVIEDNGNNVWGDYGRHYYQIQRAYEPLRPHAVCAIAFKRASADSFDLTALDDYADYSSVDSL